MKKSEQIKHIPSCAQLEKIPCPANKSLHGEKPDEHWWSGRHTNSAMVTTAQRQITCGPFEGWQD